MAKSVYQITINDVAMAAGVSKGTVDRVLHNRGEVSRKSREKVLRVIDELGYRPNVYASMLASQKHHRLVALIPEYTEGDFWSLTAKGLAEGAESVLRYGIQTDVVRYDQYDVESFQEACALVLANLPSGVILAPMFRNETLHFVNELSARGIPYIYIDSKLDDDGYMAYFGMPMYQSGYLCADILTDGRQMRKVYLVRIARDKKGLSDPTVARRTGFIDYMSRHFPETELVNVFIDPKDRNGISAKLDEAFVSEDGTLINIVMFNSRVHLVADYLRKRGLQECRVVGFDALDGNLEALRDGLVQVLIAQHSDRQATAAVNALADALILGTKASRKDNYTQMDILNRYNCDYYL